MNVTSLEKYMFASTNVVSAILSVFYDYGSYFLSNTSILISLQIVISFSVLINKENYTFLLLHE